MAAGLNLVVHNTGNRATYERPGCGRSIPDVTLASEAIPGRVVNWKVMDAFNGRDHRHITFQVRNRQKYRVPYRNRPLGWNVAKMDEELFEAYLREESFSVLAWLGRRTITSTHDTEVFVKKVMALIKGACDASMTRKK